MNIFLAPRANETSYKNFLSTIENGVDYSIVEPHLTSEGKKLLGNKDKLFVWGNKASLESRWKKMDPGDLVLFYKGREGGETKGKFVYAGKLLFKQKSKGLGLALWPPKPNEDPWSCVFFLKDLEKVYIPMADINNMAGYSENNIVQGFMPLNEKGVKTIFEKFGTIEKFLSHYKKYTPEADISDLEESSKIQAHSEAQILLLKIGKMLGYDTYSPNKNNEAYGEKLLDYITLDTLPRRFVGDDIFSLVREIDVLWFKDEFPEYAFEIEHSTKMAKGFQRLSQLTPIKTNLFIVAARKDQYLFDKYITTDPYFKNKENYRFRDYKQLENYFNAVSEFNTINSTFLK